MSQLKSTVVPFRVYAVFFSRGLPCSHRVFSPQHGETGFVSLFALVKSLIIHTDAQNYDRPTNTLGNITIPALCKSPRGSVHPSLDIVQKKEKGTDNGRDRI